MMKTETLEAMGAALGMPEAWRLGPNGLAAVLRWKGQHEKV